MLSTPSTPVKARGRPPASKCPYDLGRMDVEWLTSLNKSRKNKALVELEESQLERAMAYIENKVSPDEVMCLKDEVMCVERCTTEISKFVSKVENNIDYDIKRKTSILQTFLMICFLYMSYIVVNVSMITIAKYLCNICDNLISL